MAQREISAATHPPAEDEKMSAAADAATTIATVVAQGESSP
jgi:hypothetical protein